MCYLSFKCGLQTLQRRSEGVVLGRSHLGSGFFLWSLELAMGASPACRGSGETLGSYGVVFLTLN